MMHITKRDKNLTIKIIIATDEEGNIGRKNTIPWKLSSDIKRFKSLTTGHTVIMGRNTYESIGKPLPNRKNIVVSSFPKTETIWAKSPEAALNLCDDNSIVWICGGPQIYKTFLDLADEIHFTIVGTYVEDADAKINKQDWPMWNNEDKRFEVSSQEEFCDSRQDEFGSHYFVLMRKQ